MELHGVSWTTARSLCTVTQPQVQKPPMVKRSITSLPMASTTAPVLGRRQSMDLFECIETVGAIRYAVLMLTIKA